MPTGHSARRRLINVVHAAGPGHVSCPRLLRLESAWSRRRGYAWPSVALHHSAYRLPTSAHAPSTHPYRHRRSLADCASFALRATCSTAAAITCCSGDLHHLPCTATSASADMRPLVRADSLTVTNGSRRRDRRDRGSRRHRRTLRRRRLSTGGRGTTLRAAVPLRAPSQPSTARCKLSTARRGCAPPSAAARCAPTPKGRWA